MDQRSPETQSLMNKSTFVFGLLLTGSLGVCGCSSLPISPAVPVVSFSANTNGGARVFVVNGSQETYLCEIRQSRNNFRRILLREHCQNRFPADSPDDRTYYIPLDKNVFSDKRNVASSSTGFFDLNNIGHGPVANIVLSFLNRSTNNLFLLFGDEATGVSLPLVYINGKRSDAEQFQWIEPLKPVDSSFPFFVCLPRDSDDSHISSKSFSIPIPDGCLSVESVRLEFSVAAADHILSCKNTGEMLSHFCRFTEVFSPLEMAEGNIIP